MKEKQIATASTWDPIRELELFRGRSPFRDSSMRTMGFLDEAPSRWVPAMDVTENDDQYALTIELPGTKKEDVTVEFHENVLTIRGEKRNEREEEGEQRRYVERSYGSFSRSFTLPANAAGDRVRASFKDGVLAIEIPKREEAKPTVIAVK
jgi:HSP20 family protein